MLLFVNYALILLVSMICKSYYAKACVFEESMLCNMMLDMEFWPMLICCVIYLYNVFWDNLVIDCAVLAATMRYLIVE